jgi:drug/metabolite transporter (DMT)-like permease
VKKHAALLVIGGSALWGTDALFRRPLTGFLSPITIVLLEHCVLAVAVIPILIACRAGFRRLKGSDYALLLFVALGGSVAATSLFTFAIKYGNPSAVVLLQKTQPLFTVLLARLILGERPARRFWPWFAAAIAGAYLISNPDWSSGRSLSPEHPVIVLCALGAAGLWGSATVCGRFLVSRISTPLLTALRCILALPALLVLYGLQPKPQRALPASLPAVAGITAMALVAGLAALLLYYKGLKSTSASMASVCELSFPVTAVAVNWLVLNITLSAIQLAGAAILVAAVTVTALLSAREQGRLAAADAKPINS